MSRKLVPVRQFPRVRQGEIFDPPPIVEVRLGDVPDPRVIDGEVKLSILRGPPGSELIGPTTARCPGGVATFEGLRASMPGDYVFMAECNEETLEVIPRPSSYRYYGTFLFDLGQRINIAGNESTTGVVSEVGDDFIVVTDDSTISQQSVVAGAPSVTIDGVPASSWFAADAPGIDPTDSLALWTTDGQEAVETAGRFAPMAIQPLSGHPILNVPSPLGADRGIASTNTTTAYRYIETEPGGVPNLALGAFGVGATVLYLATYPAANLIRNGDLSVVSGSTLHLASSFMTEAASTGLNGVHIRISGQGTSGVWQLPLRLGPRGWFLLGLRYFASSSSAHRIESWINGEYFGLSTYTYNGGMGNLTAIQHAVTNGAQLSQVGIWQGEKDAEWHLEQARRCGVAP